MNRTGDIGMPWLRSGTGRHIRPFKKVCKGSSTVKIPGRSRRKITESGIGKCSAQRGGRLAKAR